MHNHPRGRGAQSNPDNRFSALRYEVDEDALDEALADSGGELPGPLTQFLPDATQSILACNDSPDIGFDTSLNPYRGCEHGCIYCYARPTHEFLGYSAGQDFETRIMVKERAPDLLRQELESPRWQPRVVAMSGVTDCYQPAERRLRLTRRCLEVFAEYRNPVMVITKNHLVTRDKDVLSSLAQHRAAAVASTGNRHRRSAHLGIRCLTSPASVAEVGFVRRHSVPRLLHHPDSYGAVQQMQQMWFACHCERRSWWQSVLPVPMRQALVRSCLLRKRRR